MTDMTANDVAVILNLINRAELRGSEATAAAMVIFKLNKLGRELSEGGSAKEVPLDIEAE